MSEYPYWEQIESVYVGAKGKGLKLVGVGRGVECMSKGIYVVCCLE
jgi:hypothetical protein